MAFDFGNISSTKQQSQARMINSALDRYRCDTMDEWIENHVKKSPDAKNISRYTFEGDGVCLWISKDAPCSTQDGMSYIVTINGMVFQSCPFPISGIKLDLDKQLYHGKLMTLYINNIVNGAKKIWEREHTKDWMMSDDWADAFVAGKVDLSEFCDIHFKTTFASYYALKQIASKFCIKKMHLSLMCGILSASPSNRMLYMGISDYLRIKINHKKELEAIGVEVNK
jgi:hypothetical protein